MTSYITNVKREQEKRCAWYGITRVICQVFSKGKILKHQMNLSQIYNTLAEFTSNCITATLAIAPYTNGKVCGFGYLSLFGDPLDFVNIKPNLITVILHHSTG